MAVVVFDDVYSMCGNRSPRDAYQHAMKTKQQPKNKTKQNGADVSRAIDVHNSWQRITTAACMHKQAYNTYKCTLKK